MKIVASFCNLDELNNLIKVDVDEFYAGILIDEWVEKNTLSFSANKRPKKNNSLSTFEELEEAFNLIEKNSKEFYLIFNNFYVNSQKDLILRIYEKAKKIGIKNFIVTDLFLIDLIKKDNLNPILSITSPVFNKQSAQFYKNLGVKKIILPRDLNLDEIEDIVKNVELDYELIIFNESCPNIDGFCRFFHGKDKKGDFVKNACIVDFNINIKSNLVGEKRIDLINRVKKNLKFANYFNFCGVCSISRLKKIGVKNLKMPSRGHLLSNKIRDIKFVKNAILELNNFNDDVKFKEKMKENYFKTYNFSCKENCYYK